jgi:hypothetical protein
MSDVSDAVARVLEADGGELHWTAIQDRALKTGLIDPFAVADVRGHVLRALAELTRSGAIEKTAKGTYRFVSRGS